MLFIAYGCQNKAVWNALKLHVEFIKDTGESISFMVEKRDYAVVKQDYPTQPIFTYKNSLDLIVQLINIKEKKIFSPVMFTTLYAVASKILKSKEIYYWVQGAVPEESFLRYQSKLKYKVLSTIEYFALMLADKQILVSPEMKHHLERKHHRSYNESIIIPCISEFSYDGSPKEKESFVYIGGMSAWQRIDLMLEMFNEIMTFKPKAHLYIATLEQTIALEFVEKHLDPAYRDHVTVLSIRDRREVEHFLSTKEYGFLIREDIVVNQVSSPIKLAEYLSCGVNVIISRAVKSYAPLIENEKAGVSVGNDNKIGEKLQNFLPNPQHAMAVYQKYFSKEKHINNYHQFLKRGEVV